MKRSIDRAGSNRWTMGLISTLGVLLLISASCGGSGTEVAEEATKEGPSAASEPAPDETTEAPEPPPEPSIADGTLLVVASDRAFDAPPKLAAGPTKIVFENEGTISHELRVVRLDNDTSLGALVREPLQKVKASVMELGVTRKLSGGSKASLELKMTPGKYGLLCLVDLGEGTTHATYGMWKELTVVKGS